MNAFKHKIPVCLLLLTTLLMAACETTLPRRYEAGTTYGSITIGAPRINSRERLINDRLEQEEWLKAQLQDVDYASFDAEARADIRSLQQRTAQLGIQASLTNTGNWLQQQAYNSTVSDDAQLNRKLQSIRQTMVDQTLDKLRKKEITLDDAKTELAGVGVTWPPPAPQANAPQGGASAPLFSAPQLPSLNSGSRTFPTLPSGASASVADVRGSPIDLFRDKLALREEIRTEIIDNGLDDAHDLGENTLFRLTFDATVLPGSDTSAWGQIRLKVKDGAQKIVELRAFELALEQRARAELRKYRQHILEATDSTTSRCDSHTDSNLKLTCYVNAVLPDSEFREELLFVLSARTGDIQASKGFSVFARSSNVIGSATVELTNLMNLTTNLQDAYAQYFTRTHGCSFIFESQRDRLNSPAMLTTFQFSIRTRKWIQQFLNEPSPLLSAQLRSCGWKSAEEAEQFVGETLSFDETTHRSYVYGVMPKETVQRISDVASRRAATEFALGLGVAAKAADVGLLMDTMKANEAFNQAIRRQPLVVGFTSSGSANAKGSLDFGWLLGPQFRITDDGKGVSFRHSPKQQALSVVLSVPKYLGSLNIEAETSWIAADGSQQLARTHTFHIDLPNRASATVEAVRAALRKGAFADRQPQLDKLLSVEVTEGSEASFIVEGADLWRGTEVYLGSQRANSIRVLSDMRGIHATFREVGKLHGSSKVGNRYPITVATSEGRVVAGFATVNRPKAGEGIPLFKPLSSMVVGTGEVRLRAAPSLTSFATLTALVRSRANSLQTGQVNEIGRSAAGDIFTFKMPVVSGLQSGDSFDVAMRLTRQPSELEVAIPAGEMIYFATEAESRIGMKTPDAPKLPVKLVLTFPKQWERLYPVEPGKQPRLMVRLASSLVLLKISSCKLEKNACTVTVDAADAAQRKKLNDAGFKAGVILEGEGGPSVVGEFEVSKP